MTPRFLAAMEEARHKESILISMLLAVFGLFGWEDQQFRFSQINLKMVILHPCGYIRETIRDPCRDSGVIRRERQIQLGIICIAVIGKTMRADDRAQRSGVNGKEKWYHHRALGHPSGEAVRYRQLTLPSHVKRHPSEEASKPGALMARNTRVLAGSAPTYL